MKRLKRILLSVMVAFGFAAPALVPAVASAGEGPDVDSNLCQGANLSFSESGSCDGGDTEAGTRIDEIIRTVVNVISLIVGVVAVIMIIVGGFRYVTSGGESGQVSGAKNTILYAIVGLVVVALAQIVVRFVVGRIITSDEGVEGGGSNLDLQGGL